MSDKNTYWYFTYQNKQECIIKHLKRYFKKQPTLFEITLMELLLKNNEDKKFDVEARQDNMKYSLRICQVYL